MTERAGRVGVLLAALGAISYGVTVVIGRDLAEAGVGSATALAGRFAVAAFVLGVLLRARRVPLFSSRRGALTGLGLGAWYAVQSTLFFSALERGTAAAVALVFYVYPAIVTVIEILRGREHPHRSTLVALVMSSAGTAIVVVAGGRVSITGAGVIFSLAAAAGFAGYLLVGRDVGRSVDPMSLACLVSMAGAVVNAGRGAVVGDLVNPSDHLLELGLYGLATASAFTLTFAAMERIGAARVAVVMTLEAASAVVLAAIFLGESVTLVQAVGGVAVLTAAAIIARSQPTMVGPVPPVG